MGLDTVLLPDIGNCVTVEDRIRTATAIAVAVHNFKIVVFCYAQRGPSAEETNQVQIAVLPLFFVVLTQFKFLL